MEELRTAMADGLRRLAERIETGELSFTSITRPGIRLNRTVDGDEVYTSRELTGESLLLMSCAERHEDCISEDSLKQHAEILLPEKTPQDQPQGS